MNFWNKKLSQASLEKDVKISDKEVEISSPLAEISNKSIKRRRQNSDYIVSFLFL